MTENPGKTTDYLNHVNVSIAVISVKFPSFITPLSPRFKFNLALSKGQMLTHPTTNCASERLSICWTSSPAHSFSAGTMLSNICGISIGEVAGPIQCEAARQPLSFFCLLSLEPAGPTLNKSPEKTSTPLLSRSRTVV